ncbi:MAG: hypothetical protein K5866_03355 [Treponema sp.]|nr:hypothetical protein [Treponema sp.]
MKKLLKLFSVFALLGLAFTSCASKPAEESAEAPVVLEPIELIYGVDYMLEPVFGTDLFYVNETSIEFYNGTLNNNHAVLFRFMDPTILNNDYDIEITYEMGNYNPEEACQLCIQPASDDGADFSAQKYPILYNNFEENEFKLVIPVKDLLKSTVKNNLVGFRMVNNSGSYEQYTWQSEWDFTITAVNLIPAAK